RLKGGKVERWKGGKGQRSMLRNNAENGCKDKRQTTNDQRPTTTDQRPQTNDQRPATNHRSTGRNPKPVPRVEFTHGRIAPHTPLEVSRSSRSCIARARVGACGGVAGESQRYA